MARDPDPDPYSTEGLLNLEVQGRQELNARLTALALGDKELVAQAKVIIAEIDRRELVVEDGVPAWVPDHAIEFWKRSVQREKEQSIIAMKKKVKEIYQEKFEKLKKRLEGVSETELTQETKAYREKADVLGEKEEDDEEKIYADRLASIARAVQRNKKRQLDDEAARRTMIKTPISARKALYLSYQQENRKIAYKWFEILEILQREAGDDYGEEMDALQHYEMLVLRLQMLNIFYGPSAPVQVLEHERKHLDCMKESIAKYEESKVVKAENIEGRDTAKSALGLKKRGKLGEDEDDVETNVKVKVQRTD